MKHSLDEKLKEVKPHLENGSFLYPKGCDTKGKKKTDLNLFGISEVDIDKKLSSLLSNTSVLELGTVSFKAASESCSSLYSLQTHSNSKQRII